MKRNFTKYSILSTIIAVVILLTSLVIIIVSPKNNDNKDVSSTVFDDSSNIASIETVSEQILSSSQITPSTSSKLTSLKKNNVVSSKIVSSSSAVSSKTESAVSQEDIKAYLPNGDWRLIVVNKEHLLPQNYQVNTAVVTGNYKLDSRIVGSYKNMISAAKNDGINIVITSAYRTYSGQVGLFNNKVNQYINKGYSREKAKELAAQYVAPPGTSEHLTGLAADLISSNWWTYNNDLNSNFEKTKEFEWLYNNCWKYGFVLRYPKDKEQITQINYEPWHYRYVGEEAAKIIMENKMCLEEYVKTLS